MTQRHELMPRDAPIDLIDERIVEEKGLLGAARAFRRRVGAGELGVLPVVIGLFIIWTVFQVANPIFLSSNNLVKMLFDSSTVGVISLGIVCVLIVGEIDLSVGSVSGLASAMTGVLWVNVGLPLPLALLCAIAMGTAIGAVYAAFYNRFGMPSFVATLSGLLAFLGLQLYVLGPTGSINLPYGSPLVTFGQQLFVPPAVAHCAIVAGSVLGYVFDRGTAKRRRAAGLSAHSTWTAAARFGVGGLICEAIVAYLDRDRGVPVMFAVFVVLVLAMNYVLTRTQAGRSAFAVGGNREAARRAGIHVDRVYLGAFIACSTLAALGGVLSAA